MKLGKHTLTEDHERRTEKYRPWERHTENGKVIPKRRVDYLSPQKVNDSGSTSDSGAWLPTPIEFECRPKIFNDPRNVSSNKENAPPVDSQTTPTFKNLNIKEDEFCDRTENLLGHESNWKAHVAQQIPLPRSSPPYPDDRPGALEQLEPEMDDDLDKPDYMTRPANDRRQAKPNKRHGPSLMIQNNCPTSQTSPDYLTMIAALEQMKQPLKEIKGILPEKKKMPHGWPACLKRTPPKVAFRYNDICIIQKGEDEHHYKEPKEPQEPQEKNMRVFYRLKRFLQGLLGTSMRVCIPIFKAF